MKPSFGRRAMIAAALISCSFVLVHGQQEPAFPTVSVKMTVTAEPHHGKDVPEIQASNVTVMQDKQRDRVVSWQPVNSPGIGTQLFVLVDDSLSTSDLGSKLGEIRSFIESQPATVQTGVAYMRNGTALIGQNLTTDHVQAAKALRLPLGESSASGSPYFSLQDLLKRWPEGVASRQVVMITNGIDPFWESNSLDDPYVNSAIDQAQKAGVVVNAIYSSGAGHFGHTFWRTTLAQSLLSELADATGGESYYLGNNSPVTFTPYFKELTEREQHQYLLTFEAQPGKKPGLQRVKLSTEVPKVDLVGQSRVYVGGI
jgi:hypothetical protein